MWYVIIFVVGIMHVSIGVEFLNMALVNSTYGCLLLLIGYGFEDVVCVDCQILCGFHPREFVNPEVVL